VSRDHVTVARDANERRLAAVFVAQPNTWFPSHNKQHRDPHARFTHGDTIISTLNRPFFPPALLYHLLTLIMTEHSQAAGAPADPMVQDAPVGGKGKGKAIEEPMPDHSMDDDSSSEEEEVYVSILCSIMIY
jgi:hypothetical protein